MGYEEFFGFKDNPFRLNPDTSYFYASDIHDQALKTLFYCVQVEGGVGQITGVPGTGKTITLQTLINQLGNDVHLSYIYDTDISPDDLLTTILLDYGILTETLKQQSSEIQMRFLKEFLIDEIRMGRPAIVIVDEAQNLRNKTLEKLRLLSNLETEKRKLFKIILVGQPELEDRLRHKEFFPLFQRITVRYSLDPLSKRHMMAYVRHRVRVASLRHDMDIFPSHVLKLIYEKTNGIPRIVNILCDRTLAAAYKDESEKIKPHHVKMALVSITGNHRPIYANKKNANPLLFILLCLLTLLLTGGVYIFGFQFIQSYLSKPDEVTHSAHELNTHIPPKKHENIKLPQKVTQVTLKPIGESPTIPTRKQTDASPKGSQRHHEKTDDQMGQNLSISVRKPPMEPTNKLLSTINQLKSKNNDVSKHNPDPNEKLRDNDNHAIDAVRHSTSQNKKIIQTNVHAQTQKQEVIKVLIEEPTLSQPQTHSQKESQMDQDKVKEPTLSQSQIHSQKESQMDQDSTKPESDSQKGLPSEILSVPPDGIVMTINTHLKQAVIWKGTIGLPEQIDHLSMSWQVRDGVYLLGKDTHKKPFLFHPRLFSTEVDQWIPKAFWEKVSHVHAPFIIPVIVGAGKYQNIKMKRQERMIRKKIDAWVDSWRNRDIETFMSLYAKTHIVAYQLHQKPDILTWDDFYSQQKPLFIHTKYLSLLISEPICILETDRPNMAIAVFSQRLLMDQVTSESIQVLYFQNTQNQNEIGPNGSFSTMGWKIYATLQMNNQL
nr:hypothetical protein [Desulfobacteraceae bacterium]